MSRIRYRTRQIILAASFVVLCISVLLVRFQFLRSGAFLWSTYLKPLSIVAAIVFVCLGIGSRLWSLLGLPSHVSETLGYDKDPRLFRLNGREYACFALLLGMGVLGNLIFLLSLMRMMSAVPMLILFAALLVCAAKPVWILVQFWWSRSHTENLTPRKRQRLGNRFFFNGFLPVFILVVIVFGLLGAFQPPDQSDALRYHLAVPEIYMHSGGWKLLPSMSFSNFPFTIEMLYSVGLIFNAPCVARLIHYLFFIITLALIYLMTDRLLGRRPATLACAAFAGIPFVPILSGWAFIEVALGAFQLAALFGMILADGNARYGSPEHLVQNDGFRRSRERSERSACLRLAGAMLGVSLAVKYTSVFLAFALFLWLLIDEYRSDKRWRNLSWFVGLAFLLSFPWYLKNAILFGNPVYPLLGDKLGWGEWSELNSVLYKFHMRFKGGLYLLPEMNLWQKIFDVISLPVRITFSPAEFGGWSIGLLLLPSLVFLPLAKSVPVRLKNLGAVAFFLFLVWAYTYRDSRFLMPVFAVAAIAIGITTDGLLQSPYGKGRLASISLGLLLAINFVLFSMNYVGDFLSPRFLTGEVSTEQYLESKLEQYPVYRELEKYPDSKALFVGEYRGLYCPIDYVASDWFDTPVIVELLRKTDTNDKLLQRLKGQGIVLVVYNESELQKYFLPWFALHLLPEETAVSMLKNAMEQGRTLNSPEERRLLMREVERSLLFGRFQDLLGEASNLESLWEENGVKILRITEG